MLGFPDGGNSVLFLKASVTGQGYYGEQVSEKCGATGMFWLGVNISVGLFSLGQFDAKGYQCDLRPCSFHEFHEDLFEEH